ncbi:MAG: hypothetical protein M3N23_01660, partial [Pseudomonadota bacterium]|nr:hypothetical protein [Pseudomonadota bacterium]
MKPSWDPRTEDWGVPRAARVVADYASAVLIGRAFGSEEVDVANALGRIAAHDVASRLPIPNHQLAGVRGDVLRSADTCTASEACPVRLEPSGPPPSANDNHRLPSHAPGEARSTLPYALMPRGADAVLSDMSPYYQGKRLREKMRQRIVKPVPSGLDVIAIGADVATDHMLVYTGRRITPGDIASLCFGGVGRITVFKRPHIA